MFIIGIMLTVAGVASAIFGIVQNSSLVSQLYSFLASGSVNPGAIWILVGVVAAAIGIILMALVSIKPARGYINDTQ